MQATQEEMEAEEHRRRLQHRPDQKLIKLCVGLKDAVRKLFIWTDYEVVSSPFCDKSLNVFSKANPFRRGAIQLSHFPAFRALTLMAIIANCIMLAFDSNEPGFDQTSLYNALRLMDLVFLCFFTFEAVLNIVARGLVAAPHTYLKNGWNVLDVIIIITGFLSLVSSSNFTAARGFRALRPLRTVTRIRELRVLIKTLVGAIPMVCDVLLLVCFYLAVFGATTLQLFTGILVYRCGAPDFTYAYTDPATGFVKNVTYVVPGDQQDAVCKFPKITDINWVNRTLGSESSIVLFNTPEAPSQGRTCPWQPTDDNPYGLFCTPWGNPGQWIGDLSQGFRSFDNILFSWLSLFNSITLTDWTQIMYNTQDAASWWTWLLHVPMSAFGGLVLVNLMLAVLYARFTADNQAADLSIREKQAQEQSEQLQESSTHHDNANGHESLYGNGSYEHDSQQQLNQSAHVKGVANGAAAGQLQVAYPVQVMSEDLLSTPTPATRVQPTLSPFHNTLPQQPHKEVQLTVMNGKAHTIDAAQVHIVPAPDKPRARSRCWVGYLAACKYVANAFWFEVVSVFVIVLNAIILGLVWFNQPETSVIVVDNLNYACTMFFLFEVIVLISGLGPTNYFAKASNWFDFWVTIAGVIDMITALLPNVSATFKGTITALRLLRVLKLARFSRKMNRLLLGMGRAAKSVGWLVLVLLVFMYIMGLLGVQMFGYKLQFCDLAKDSFQRCPPGASCPKHFDCWVTCTPDQLNTWFPVDGSPFGGQAYCQRFPPLPPGSNATSPAAASPNTVQYLANVGKPSYPNANFDNIFSAFVTIFQLLTLDNWVDPTYAAMQALSPWYALWFVITIVVGSFIIFQLFLAVLLENLDSEAEQVSADGVNPLLKNAVEGLKTKGSGIIAGAAQLVADPSMGLKTMAAVTSGLTGFGSKRISDSGNGNISLNTTPSASDIQRMQSYKSMGADSDSTVALSTTVPATPVLTTTDDSITVTRGPSVSSMSRGSTPQHLTLDSRGTSTTSCRIIATSSARHVVRSVSEGVPRTANGGTGMQAAARMARSASVGARQSASGLDLARAHTPISIIPESMPMTHVDSLRTDLGPASSVGKDTHIQKQNSVSLFEASQALDQLTQGSMKRTTQDDILVGRSLHVFGPSNKLRVQLYRVVHESTWFEVFMTAMVVGSCVALCFETADVDPGSTTAKAVYWAGAIFSVIFSVEAVLKIVVLGLAFTGPNAYLRSGWNIVDLLIAVLGLVVAVLQPTLGTDVVWLQAAKGLRGIRLLRVASKLGGVKVVWMSIVGVLPTLAQVMVFGLLFFYIFGVVMVNLLMGRMQYCTDGDGNVLDAYYFTTYGSNINRSWCEASKAGPITVNTSWYHSQLVPPVPVPEFTLTTSWTKDLRRFDNVGQALYTLYQMASLESWSDVMYAAAAAVGVDEQPIRDANRYISLLFITFMMVGALFLLNMVIGVSINKFHKMKAEHSGRSAFLSEKQQEWLTVQRVLAATKLKVRYDPPENPLRAVVFKLVMTRWFDHTMTVVIILNVLAMFLVHSKQPQPWDDALSVANVVFTALFTLEMLAKWTAIGLPAYFRETWNQFDSLIVVLSIVGVFLDYFTSSNGRFLPLLRIFRVARIFKLVSRAKGLEALLRTLWWSLPAVGNICAVLFVFMYIYAIIGMSLFGAVKQQEDGVTRHANFARFSNAMLTEFRMLTGENWNDIMEGCMVKEDCIFVTRAAWALLPDGTNSTVQAGQYLDPVDNKDLIAALPKDVLENRCSPGPWIAVLYFFSYMMVCTYLLIQLVIGSMLDNIEEAMKIDELPIGMQHTHAFREAWCEVQPDGSNLMPVSNLTYLLMRVPPPLGVRGMDRPLNKVHELVLQMDVPLRNGKVHYVEVLHSLAKRVCYTDVPFAEEATVIHMMVKKLPKSKQPLKLSVAQAYAASALASSIRGCLRRKQMAAVLDARVAGDACDSFTAAPRWTAGSQLSCADLQRVRTARFLLQNSYTSSPPRPSPPRPAVGVQLSGASQPDLNAQSFHSCVSDESFKSAKATQSPGVISSLWGWLWGPRS